MGKRGRPTLASQGKERRTDAQRARDSYQRKKELAQRRKHDADMYWQLRAFLDAEDSRPSKRPLQERTRAVLNDTLQSYEWAVKGDEPPK
jgi:hypothetical protein